MIRLSLTLPVLMLFVAGWRVDAAAIEEVSDDEVVIARQIKSLHDQRSEVRARAAEVLRRLVAKHASGTVNIRSKDGGEVYWNGKLQQLKANMTKAEVHQIFPKFTVEPEESTMAYGESNFAETYRLDFHWLLDIQYTNHDKVIKRADFGPKLVRRAARVYVNPPANYSGTWITWYVNGQKGYEIPYRNGKYHGAFIHYHDNGRKGSEQHYLNHKAEGTGAGWYSDGKKSYEILYRNDKQEGRTIHWYQNGTKRSEQNYKNGTLDGAITNWYENGQKQLLMTYKSGKQHGISAAWDEKGQLQYETHFEDNKPVEKPPAP